MAIARKKRKPKPQPAVIAVHESTDTGHHQVGIWNLHVLLIPEGDYCVAQGIEIDYVVQGSTIEEAKVNFETGLERTIDLNLKMYDNIEGLLVFAPDEVLQEAARNKKLIKLYSQVTSHNIQTSSQDALPFDGITFLIQEAVV